MIELENRIECMQAYKSDEKKTHAHLSACPTTISVCLYFTWVFLFHVILDCISENISTYLKMQSVTLSSAQCEGIGFDIMTSVYCRAL